MVLLNYATKEIVAKIVYYGPGLCGKTTNLQMVYAKLNPKKRGKMISLATEADRTLFFDFLPMELGTVQGFKVRFQLYTVPGQVFYGATRKLVLKGADAVVFVADSQADVLDKNIESLEDMKQNLMENNLDPEVIPIVFQWNKRDLPAVMSVEELNEKLNWRGLPNFEGVAVDGTGVVEVFREITRLLIMDLKRKHSFMDTDKIKDLPPEIFETKKDEPVEEVEPTYELELGSFIRDDSTEDDVVAGELLDQIETFSANDYQQAETFFDNVRKGSTAEEAKARAGLKADQKGAIELSGGYGDEMVIERMSSDRDTTCDGERELTPEELEAAEPVPDVVPEPQAELAPASGTGMPLPPPPSVEYMLGLDNDYRKVMDPDHGVSEPSATIPRPEPAPPTPQPPSRRDQAPAPAPAAPVQAKPAAPKREPASPPVSQPAVSPPPPASVAQVAPQVDMAPLLLAMERLGARLDKAPILVDPSPILAAVQGLQKEVASLRSEVDEVKAGINAVSLSQASYVPSGEGLPAAPAADISPILEKLHKEFMAAMEGQDRLMLSILEAVREGRKKSADAHETLEHGLKYISDRLRDIPKEDDKGGKKKWF